MTQPAMTKKRRVYEPRIVGGKVMMPADLRRLHKYMLDIAAWVMMGGAAVRLAELGRLVKEMIGGITGWQDEGFELAHI